MNLTSCFLQHYPYMGIVSTITVLISAARSIIISAVGVNDHIKFIYP